MNDMSRSHPILALVTALYLGLMIVLTFMKNADGRPPSPLWSLVSFIVLGVLLSVLSSPRRWWVALGFGVLGAAWIEAAQTIWGLPGWANLADLGAGALGTAIGVAAVVVVRAVRARARHGVAPAAAPVRPRS